MTCSFCALEFDPSLSREACTGCSLAGDGCRSVRCPSCGYHMPEEPAVFARLRAWVAGRARTRARNETTTVADMSAGERGTIVKLDTGSSAQARKLMALGVLPGCTVELDRRHPAFVLRLGYTQLAIDAALAASVIVRIAALAALFLMPSLAAADEKPIQDNSFLIEEAYNQEPGVIQHISTFHRDLSTGEWHYTFTEEWPVFGQRHQLSATVPIEGEDATRLGDVLVNYRLQVSSGAVAFAPRLSAVLPTGDDRHAGVQANLPLSLELPAPIVVHLNAGATVLPGADEPLGAFGGASLIWLAGSKLNFLVETFGQVGEVDEVVVSPGLRAAIDVASLQIVPGLAVPVNLDGGEAGVFAYLSFEHPIASR